MVVEDATRDPKRDSDDNGSVLVVNPMLDGAAGTSFSVTDTQECPRRVIDAQPAGASLKARGLG